MSTDLKTECTSIFDTLSVQKIEQILSENKNLKFIDLVNLLPNINWDLTNLSSVITLKDYIDNFKLPWNHYFVAESIQITLDDVKNHPELHWKFKGLSKNKNIKIKDIIDNPQFAWNFEEYSQNPNLRLGDVYDNNLEWDIKNIIHTYKFENLDILYQRPFYIDEDQEKLKKSSELLSMNKNISIDTILTYRTDHFSEFKAAGKKKWKKIDENIKWDWDLICEIHRDISIKHVLDNPKIKWNWIQLSKNIIINIDEVKKYHKVINFDWSSLTYNPHIGLNDILNTPELPWDFKTISMNPNITLDDVENDSEIKWDWNMLSENIKMNVNQFLEYNLKYPQMKWDFDSLCINTHLLKSGY